MAYRIKSYVESVKDGGDEENYTNAVKTLSENLKDIIDDLAKSRF